MILKQDTANSLGSHRRWLSRCLYGREDPQGETGPAQPPMKKKPEAAPCFHSERSGKPASSRADEADPVEAGVWGGAGSWEGPLGAGGGAVCVGVRESWQCVCDVSGLIAREPSFLAVAMATPQCIDNIP